MPSTRTLFPRADFTTKDLVRTYEALAPVLLPHLAGRPLSLKRYPDDVEGEAFWEKDAPSFTPKWVQRMPVPRKREPGVINYVGIPDLKTLRWAAGLGCVEIHGFLHRYPYITVPTLIAFDLDPGNGATLVDCCRVAVLVRDWFAAYKLQSWAKVSGSKGIQVYVPLNTPTSYEVTQPIAKHVAEELERQHPRTILSRMARAERAGKVFIDWSQNAEHKTTVTVYSVRAKRTHPYVSMPITWDEVLTAMETGEVDDLIFTPKAAIERVERQADLFAPVLSVVQELPPKLLRTLKLRAPGKPVPVQVPEIKPSVYKLPRSSGQGGRRVWVAHEHRGDFDLSLEADAELQRFLFEQSLPVGKGMSAFVRQEPARPISYLTDESAESGIVWDLGTYEVVEGSLSKGAVDLYLSGRKLDGEWRFTRTDEGWEMANAGGKLKKELPLEASALPGHSIRQAKPPQPRKPSAPVKHQGRSVAFTEPMECKPVERLPEGEGWTYEVKLDGYRAQVIRDADTVRLLSRNGKSLTEQFPGPVRDLHALPPGTVVDGEIVAVDEQGRPSFQLLQNRGSARPATIFYAFDLLLAPLRVAYYSDPYPSGVSCWTKQSGGQPRCRCRNSSRSRWSAWWRR